MEYQKALLRGIIVGLGGGCLITGLALGMLSKDYNHARYFMAAGAVLAGLSTFILRPSWAR